MVFKKIIFQNSLMANETPSRPPPFMANAILNFHFDYRHTSLIEINVTTLTNPTIWAKFKMRSDWQGKARIGLGSDKNNITCENLMIPWQSSPGRLVVVGEGGTEILRWQQQLAWACCLFTLSIYMYTINYLLYCLVQLSTVQSSSKSLVSSVSIPDICHGRHGRCKFWQI